ncbi:DUF262 domain-containing HNH endonuclease family protein [Flavobacterium frigidarium]|uniref:DUF262 domain-containing protein n=1 Tax=Flavobacterium frigidarium TaxID=99286 RepID=UPI0030D7B0B7|tara:strand:- start:3289 stop:5238 length:1950 start_codon:yes stop_codon:yes gene_type:complete
MNETNELTTLNIKTLFSGNKYTIPIYQRNYAWQEDQVKQLIQDIWDFAIKNKDSNYYIGTLVVFKRKSDEGHIYETIDGQQRLTTLNILLSVLKHEFNDVIKKDLESWVKLNLQFDSRPISDNTLKAVFNKNGNNYDTYNTSIQHAYTYCKSKLNHLLKDKSELSIDGFCHYLYEYVTILRVAVPEDTNLNHYFEIMNSRGEQLEKHEVLKATCLSEIKNDDKSKLAFNMIWEACSNMEKYVQYSFRIEERNEIFGYQNWNDLTITSFDSVADKVNRVKSDRIAKANTPQELNKSFSLAEIINSDKKNYNYKDEVTDDSPDRFNSVINFQNFLLHVLRVQIYNSDDIESNLKLDIPLDDKRLLKTFENIMKSQTDKVQFVKDFGYNLLKCRFLFDKYILKRAFVKEKDGWSLKRLKWNPENRGSYVNSFGEEEVSTDNKSLMLLAMFHVSAPTLVYKYWLNAALNYLYVNCNSIIGNNYISYLESLSNAYYFDRFIAETPIDYDEIIYLNNGISCNSLVNKNKLHQGTEVENFVFNRLDYLLWKEKHEGYDKFEFAFRSSVEHYYPQIPLPGHDKLDNNISNNFGNLCLISRSKNSKLSNNLPEAKKEHYKKSIDSLKQKEMMKYSTWFTDEIIKHGNEMIAVLDNKSN